MLIQAVPLKKLGEEHLVHSVFDKQRRQGVEQLLQVLSLVSPHVPSGQVSKQVLLLKNSGEVQLVQKLAESFNLWKLQSFIKINSKIFY